MLTEQIKGFYDASRKTYGAPRIWLDLRPDDPRDSADLPGADDAGLFTTLETELFRAHPHRRFNTHRDAKLAVFDYLEVFYNRHRRHTSIGGIPPVTFTRNAEIIGPAA